MAKKSRPEPPSSDSSSSDDEQLTSNKKPVHETPPNNNKEEEESDDESEDESEDEEQRTTSKAPAPETPANNHKAEEEESDGESEDESEDESGEEEVEDKDEHKSKKSEPSSLTPSKPASDSGGSGSGSGTEESDSDSEAAKLVTPISSRPMADAPAEKTNGKVPFQRINGVAANGGEGSLKRKLRSSKFPDLKEAVGRIGTRYADMALENLDLTEAEALDKRFKKQKVAEMKLRVMEADLWMETLELLAEGMERSIA